MDVLPLGEPVEALSQVLPLGPRVVRLGGGR